MIPQMFIVHGTGAVPGVVLPEFRRLSPALTNPYRAFILFQVGGYGSRRMDRIYGGSWPAGEARSGIYSGRAGAPVDWIVDIAIVLCCNMRNAAWTEPIGVLVSRI